MDTLTSREVPAQERSLQWSSHRELKNKVFRGHALSTAPPAFLVLDFVTLTLCWI